MTRLYPVAAGLALALLVTLGGCGTADPVTADPVAEDPAAAPATAGSLVAAAEEHLGRDAAIAAPLAPRDGVPADSLGVEVAFDEPEGDNSHVTLVVGPAGSRYADLACGRDELRDAEGCEQATTDDGATTILTWSRFAPEEDPGGIQVFALRHDRVVSAFYSGQEVPPDLPDSDLAGLARALLALVADPAVGFETSTAYAERGDALPDGVLLDWYGQGNGAPAPKTYRGAAG